MSVNSALVQLYERVDAVIAARKPRCDASGRCCHFREWGHTLFLSRIEAEHLLATAPPYSLPVNRDGCPFQVGKLCTARNERPLGCRIYFCDESFDEEGKLLMESSLQELKELANLQGLGWEYAPLHRFLESMARPGIDGQLEEKGSPLPDGRLPLPMSDGEVL